MALAAVQHQAPGDGIEQDLGPLAWVFDELRKSLEAANKALTRYAAEVASARDSDISAVDPTPLRLARGQLHQVVGALEMVDFLAPAAVVRAMEAAVQRFISRPLLCTAAAAAKLERAGFALVEYLELLLAGKSVQAVALFPQYRDVQELAGAARIHPADLWGSLPRGFSPALPPEWGIAALPPGPQVRERFDRYVLHVVKNQHPIAAAHLREVSLGLAAGAPTPALAAFWLTAAAYFEGIQHRVVPDDVYVKRAASRVLLQYTAQAQGKTEVSASVWQDLLFFVARAERAPEVAHSALALVRAALPPQRLVSVDYERATLGRYDPAILAQARRRVQAAREGWSLLAGGDTDKLRQVGDQFALVADSLAKLLPDAAALAQALVHAIGLVRQSHAAPSAELGMEVATAILFLEALLEDLELDDPELPHRLREMAQRVQQACRGQPSAPLQAWMEELYRKVSDRQTMGSVVGELKVALTELERDLDAFVRNPADKTPLTQVPQRLQQMRGVLSVLGLDAAVAAVGHMRQAAEALLTDDVDIARAREAGTLGRLANNLSVLGFLIDMLHYQPALVRKLFAFDAQAGELRHVMGRRSEEALTPAAPAARGASPTVPPAPAPAPKTASAPVPRAKAAPPTIASAAPVTAPAASSAAPVAPPAAAAQTAAAEAPALTLAPLPPSAPVEPAAAEAAVDHPASAAASGTQAEPSGLEWTTEPATEPLPLADFAPTQPGGLADEPRQAPCEPEPVELLPALEQTPAEVTAPAREGMGPAAAALAAAVPQAPSSPPPGDDLVEDDLRDIFLEEARDVIRAGQAALAQLAHRPGDLSEQTTLRRAFHTLKGSSRMVGLATFGEAAWAMEQVMNAWLASGQPVTADLLALCGQAMERFAQWVEDIAAHQDAHWRAEPFARASEAMRQSGTRLPLDPPAASASSLAPAALPVSTADPLPPAAAPQAEERPAPASDPALGIAVQESGDAAEPVQAGPTATASLPGEEAEPDVAQSIEVHDLDGSLADLLPVAEEALAQAVGEREAKPEPLPETDPEAAALPEGEASLPSPAAQADEPSFPPAAQADGEDFAWSLDVVEQEPSPEGPLDAVPTATDSWQLPPAAAPAPSPTAAEATPADGLDADDAPAALESGITVELDTDWHQLLHAQALPTPAEPVEPEPSLAEPDQPAELPLLVDEATGDEASAGLDATLTVELADPTDPTAPLAEPGPGADEPAAAAPSAKPAAPHWDSALDFDVPLRPDPPKPRTVLPEAAAPAATLEPEAEAEAMAALPLATPSPAEDDEAKHIGGLRIGAKLFNVFLNEADEWSRRLEHALGEWRLQEPQWPLPPDASAWAHSLAGASGAIGFSGLSALARALEHALDALEAEQRHGLAVAAADADGVTAAAQELRRLLHQFAAGFLREPSAALLEQLQAIAHRPLPTLEPEDAADVPPPTQALEDALAPESPEDPTLPSGPAASATPTDGAPTVPVGPLAPLNAAPSVPVASEPAADAAADSLGPPVQAEPPVPAAAQLQPAAWTAHTEASTAADAGVPEAAVPSVDDDIDAVDTLDADLFQIFEEEAQELFPRLSQSLRQWMAQPENLAARAELLRALHTLKGSARLAGALRLGEMAHRMETAAERLGSEVRDPQALEPLATQLDALTARFEALCLPPTQAVAHRQLSLPEAASALSVPAPTASLLQATQPPAEAPPAAEAAAAAALAPDQASGPMPQRAPDLAAAQPPGAAPSAAALSLPVARLPERTAASAAAAAVRVRPELLDRLVNQAGEVMISRSRMQAELAQLRTSLADLTDNLERLRRQLRDVELQAESQMQSRLAQSRESDHTFDPLEFDRFTRMQELTRMMAESVNDVATVQRTLQKAVDGTEDALAAQARQTRELQRDLLRTRMVEFEGIAERLYRVVRQAAKEAGKPVRLDIVGGRIEVDRAVLDRMTPAFEHLLRNCVVHGIEPAAERAAAGKPAEGRIGVELSQEGNEVSVSFVDDGRGLNLEAIRRKAVALGLLQPDEQPEPSELAQLIFAPGLSTAESVTGLAGRGIGMDVVRAEVAGLGGRIETTTEAGKGTRFRMVLPLTTAVTQVVMLRAGQFSFGVPAGLVEVVRRVSAEELAAAQASGEIAVGGESLPFYWAGALLQLSRRSDAPAARTVPVVIFRSAAQRVAVQVDEVLGNQEVVVKNLGPQLSRLPGLAATTVLASGAVALIYNPVALAAVYGEQVRQWLAEEAPFAEAPAASLAVSALPAAGEAAAPAAAAPPALRAAAAQQAPLVLVVDDSITVRRVTQRLLVREGYRVALAADGLQALEKLAQERPAVVLSDIEMPRMDGFDLVRNIRSDPRLADLPVVMITSRIADKHREHARQLGVDHYLGKPYSEEELLSWVQHYARAQARACEAQALA